MRQLTHSPDFIHVLARPGNMPYRDDSWYEKPSKDRLLDVLSDEWKALSQIVRETNLAEPVAKRTLKQLHVDGLLDACRIGDFANSATVYRRIHGGT